MIKFRCSSLGRLMTEPKTKAEGVLSVGAKTYIRELAAESIFGVSFNVSSKAMEKGIQCEPQSIDLLSLVIGKDLVKNTERRSNEFLTGEPDLVAITDRHGWDIKTSWSIKTFPITEADAVDKDYAMQMAGYMMLFDCDTWTVAYCLVDTPENLIGYEPPDLHMVSHIPPHHRVTTWELKRDAELEAKIEEKCKAAQKYYLEVIEQFHESHQVRF
jgi:hypothetical protein